jgi:hypothetical protein
VTDKNFMVEAAAVAVAFPGTTVMNIPGRLLLRIPAVTVREPWSPSSIRALLVCDTWPAQRPRLLVGDELIRAGAPPQNFNRELIEGAAWYGFSFNAAYLPEHPALVPVVRGWLRRFDGRPE